MKRWPNRSGISGATLWRASDAQEAFKLIKEVDAAFLDLNMPGISGIEFLREAKPLVPVIVLTAFADSSNTIEAIRLGAFDHLTKPIGRADLRHVLIEALSLFLLNGNRTLNTFLCAKILSLHAGFELRTFPF